jgi:hypothetical protein
MILGSFSAIVPGVLLLFYYYAVTAPKAFQTESGAQPHGASAAS